MADKDSKGLPVLGLVATAAAITGAIIYTQVPLEVLRPSSSQGVAYRDRSVQDVPARLWEDPFAAVSRQLQGAAKAFTPLDTATLVELAQKVDQKSQAAAEPDRKTGPQDDQARQLDPCDAPGVKREECEPHRLAWLMRDIRFALGQEQTKDARDGGSADAKPKPNKLPRVLVLGVMVSNSPYVDGEERRRRVRYAVQSGLNLALYSPLNAEHIGYVINRDHAGLPQVIPFEWFRRKGSSPDRRALVLWLEEEALTGFPARAPAPLANLGRIVELVQAHTRAKPGQLEFKMVGPATSGGLKTMTSEVKGALKKRTDSDAPRPPPLAHLRGVELFSGLATASEEQMLCDKADRAANRKSGNVDACTFASFLERNSAELFGEPEGGMKFLRSIASDDAVTYSLIEELKRRGVDLGSGKDYVALVSEWDTYYGRMLPQAFLRSLDDIENRDEFRFQEACEEDPEERLSEVKTTQAPSMCPVLRYSYLRGLDGQQAQGQAAPVQAQVPKADSSNKAPSTEAPEGTKQFDYLRRLADRIQETNFRLKRAGKEISAIGIVGSDVYDKLAVLRALRKQFPRAVFFSTDLDARLLDPNDYTWARNMILASSFGLQLHPCLQKEIPPFRNSYQTATFFTTRLALFNSFGDAQKRLDRCPEFDAATDADPALSTPAPPLTQGRIASWLFPRIFEVGKSRAWDLTVEPIDSPTFGNTASHCLGLHLCSSIHPPRLHLVQRSSKTAAITLAVFAAAVVVMLWWVRGRNPRQPAETEASAGPARHGSPAGLLWLRWGLLIWAIGVAAASLVFAIQDWQLPEGEPFAWVDGISLWPTELLQVAALLLIAFFIGDVFNRIQLNTDGLTRELGLTASRDTRSTWDKLLGQFTISRVAGSGIDVAQLWHQYIESGQIKYSIIRTLLFVALFSLLGVVLFKIFGWPNRPYRGEVSNIIDWVLFVHVALLSAFLLFVVNDATRLTTMFINALTRHHADIHWPDRAAQEFSSRLGYQGADQLTSAFITIHLIAKRTAAINSLIYYPFFAGALIIVCRSSVFDNWDMPVSSLAIFAIGVVIACASPLIMQRAASKAKSANIKALQGNRLQSKGRGERRRVSTLDALIEHLEAIKEGAFQPFLEQPMVRAAMLPFGGAGGLYLLDFFNFAGF